jgi:hypothetical protein
MCSRGEVWLAQLRPSHTSKSAATPRLWLLPSKSFAHNQSCCGRHLLLTEQRKHARNSFQIARLLRLFATAALDPWMRPTHNLSTRLLHGCTCATQLSKLEVLSVLDTSLSHSHTGLSRRVSIVVVASCGWWPRLTYPAHVGHIACGTLLLPLLPGGNHYNITSTAKHPVLRLDESCSHIHSRVDRPITTGMKAGTGVR